MKLTKSQFDHYKKNIHKWARAYGLHNTAVVVVKMSNAPDEEEECSSAAWTFHDTPSTMTFFGVDPNQEDNTKNKDIERWAFHEVWEKMLWQIREELEVRGLSREYVNRLVHDVIRRAENEKFGF